MTDITAPPAVQEPTPPAVVDWLRKQHDQQAEYDRMAAENERLHTTIAVQDDQIRNLKHALSETSARADHYSRMNAEFTQIFENVSAIIIQAAKARQLGAYRPNGAAPVARDEVPEFLKQGPREQ